MKTTLFTISLIGLILLTGCSSNPNSSMARQCEEGLDSALEALNYAETQGFSGTVEYTKAASLLGAAQVQYEFGKYPNCIDKVKKARVYINRSKK
ncbi:MAG: hypothetical protein GY934_10890 [Gammaproteobacteria bacterium]|nr:hypothetical protein [Gammaproteobacteria bacterium]